MVVVQLRAEVVDVAVADDPDLLVYSPPKGHLYPIDRCLATVRHDSPNSSLLDHFVVAVDDADSMLPVVLPIASQARP